MNLLDEQNSQSSYYMTTDICYQRVEPHIGSMPRESSMSVQKLVEKEQEDLLPSITQSTCCKMQLNMQLVK